MHHEPVTLNLTPREVRDLKRAASGDGLTITEWILHQLDLRNRVQEALIRQEESKQ